MGLKQRLQNRQKSVISSNMMTAQQFLSLKNETGYFTKDEFDVYINSLRDRELAELEEFTQGIKDGYRMNNSLTTKTDRAGRLYVYCTLLKPNANPGYKIVTEGGMFQLLKDLQEGKTKIDFNLSDLVDELEA